MKKGLFVFLLLFHVFSSFGQVDTLKVFQSIQPIDGGKYVVNFQASGCSGVVVWFLSNPDKGRSIGFGNSLSYVLARDTTFYITCQGDNVLISQVTRSIKLPKQTSATSATSNYSPQLTPPSPNAASLGMYGNIPVSYYSGLPNISIPFYTIEEQDINVPISLSYHASGIRVEQEASNVGLAWALNAGGVITRTVRKTDDLEQNLGWCFNPIPNEDAIDATFITSFCNKNGVSTQGIVDSEPDIFYYNIGGKAGKFILESKANNSFPIKAILLDQSDISISVNKTSEVGSIFPIYEWTLKTPEGLVYTFSEQEKSQSVSSSLDYGSQGTELNPIYFEINDTHPTDMTFPYSASSGQGITAWYLTKIRSQNSSASVNFNYDQENAYYSTSRIGASEIAVPSGFGTCGVISTYNKSSYNYSATISSQVYLKSITFSNGRLDFTHSDRNDISIYDGLSGSYPLGDAIGIWGRIANRADNLPKKNPQKLDKISLSSSAGFLKSWDFSYSYFNESLVGFPIVTYKDQIKKYKNLRLRLNSVQEKGTSSVIPPHKFVYYGDVADNLGTVTTAVLLPAKTSQAKDYFGYYNGNESNNSLSHRHLVSSTWFPKAAGYRNSLNETFGFDIIGYGQYTDGIDREVNSEKAKYGTLQEIIYPTGGRTAFTYQSPKALGGANEVEYFNYEVNNGNSVSFTVPLINNSYSQFYSATLTNSLTCSGSSTCGSCTDCGTIPSSNNSLWYAKTESPNGVYSSRTYADWQNKTCTSSAYGYNCKYTNTSTLLLNPGLNTLRTNTLGGGLPKASASLTGYFYHNQDYKEINGAGLIIAKIDDYNTNNVLSRNKTYSYLSSNGSWSGKFLRPLVKYTYGYIGCLKKQWENGQWNYCTSSDPNVAIWQTELHSTGVFPLGSENGGQIIGYNKVSVFETSPTSNGKTEYFYQNEKDILPVNDIFPQTPSLANLGNGMLLKENFLSSANDTVKTVAYVNATKISSQRIINPFRYINCGGTSPYIYYSYYKMPSEFWFVSQKKERIYDQLTPTSFLETLHNYEYNGSNHFQLTKETTINSIYKSIETSYTYPPDMGTSPYLEMASKNIISPVIVQQTKVSGNQIAWQNKTYQAINGVNGVMYVPYQIRTQTTSNASIRTEVSFNSYDVNGNLTAYEALNSLNQTIDYFDTSIYGKSKLIKGITNSLSHRISYDYLPLHGLNELRDATSKARYYEFDDLMRLNRLRDQNSNISDKFTYQYANPSAVSCNVSPPIISISGYGSACQTLLSAAGCTNGASLLWSNGVTDVDTYVSTTTSVNLTATCKLGLCSSTPSNSITIPTLPSNWQSTDIGNPPLAGCTQYFATTSLTMQGTGNVFDVNDKLHYVYLTATGDVTIIAKVASLNPTDGFRSGIMLRNSLDPNSAYFEIIQDGNSAVGRLKRITDNQAGLFAGYNFATLNNTWLKVVKTGVNVYAYFSTDYNGSSGTWNPDFVNSQESSPTDTMNLNASFLLGFAVYNGTSNGSATNATTFTNITINGQSY